jgi:hypothetical protein
MMTRDEFDEFTQFCFDHGGTLRNHKEFGRLMQELRFKLRTREEIQMKKQLVYVAGPYTSNPNKCTNLAIDVGDWLAIDGYIPVIPHLTHFWHKRIPHDWEFWMEMDSAVLEKCDMLVRIPGESKGADMEVEQAKLLGIPVMRIAMVPGEKWYLYKVIE